MNLEWTEKSTTAYQHARDALKTVDKLFDFAKSTSGKPSDAERALFAATIVFIYGIWENYIEQLAIEVVSNLAPNIDPSKLPEAVRNKLKNKNAWELLVHPGWRMLWLDTVTTAAIGDGNNHGLNTAKSSSVKYLLSLAGIDTILDELPDSVSNAIPEHVKVDDVTTLKALDVFVELRGEIVHTGKAPSALRKHHVKKWKLFIEVLIEEIDASSRHLSKEYLS